MKPATYRKPTNRQCHFCKYLIDGLFCSYGETRKNKDLLEDLKWQIDNEVYDGATCDNWEQQKWPLDAREDEDL